MSDEAWEPPKPKTGATWYDDGTPGARREFEPGAGPPELRAGRLLVVALLCELLPPAAILFLLWLVAH